MGQVMSRDDLAGYFTRAHSKAIPETRTQRPVDPADYTVKFGTNSLVRPPPAAVATLRAGCSALHCPALLCLLLVPANNLVGACMASSAAQLWSSPAAPWSGVLHPGRVCRPAGRGSCCDRTAALQQRACTA